jgi:hypothetical protein
MRIAAALAVGGLVLTTPAAQATDGNNYELQTTLDTTSVGGVAATPLGLDTGIGNNLIFCGGTIDDIHYSVGAGGAIFKTRVQCTGVGSITRVLVLFKCTIRFRPNGSSTYFTRFSDQSGYSQWVNVNGSAVTYYCPRPALGNAGVGYGDWQGTASIQITYPQAGVPGSQTKTWFKNIKRP